VKTLQDLIDEAGRNAVCAGSHRPLHQAVNEALERAAKVCEELVHVDDDYRTANTCSDCATAVRALKVEVERW
jgi:hypothetical protein